MMAANTEGFRNLYGNRPNVNKSQVWIKKGPSLGPPVLLGVTTFHLAKKASDPNVELWV